MPDAALWAAVHQERHRLVADLQDVPTSQWEKPSLCPGWSVHDVLAHLIDAATTTRPGFLRQMIAARFDFDRANEQGIERHRADHPAQTLEAFRAVADRSATPPAPLATRLVEAFVHGEDVRRPLQIQAVYPLEHVLTALAYQARTGAGLGGGKERVQGLLLCPTDTDARIGAGTQVLGGALALLMAVSGRPVREGELAGPGADILTARAPRPAS